MTRRKLFLLSVFCVVYGIIAGWASVHAQPPSVSVKVAVESQSAIRDDAPTLPDDFAGNDPARVSAVWSDSDSAIPNARQVLFPQLILYTADGFPCPACVNQQKVLKSEEFSKSAAFSYLTIPVDDPAKAPLGSVPCWAAPDGVHLSGWHSIDRLNTFAVQHSGKPANAPAASNASKRDSVEVSIDGGTSASVLSALAAHVQREQMQSGERVSQGLLPEIDVELNDGILKLIDSLMTRDGYQSGGLSVKWPGTERSISFSPPAEVRFEKIVQIDVLLEGIDVNGRKITLRLRKFPDLTVRLKGASAASADPPIRDSVKSIAVKQSPAPKQVGALATVRNWVRSRYSPGTFLLADVSPRSKVWQHLTAEHGYPYSAVSGLVQWKAMALHDAAHKGLRVPGF